jgi:hypothetical protein
VESLSLVWVVSVLALASVLLEELSAVDASLPLLPSRLVDPSPEARGRTSTKEDYALAFAFTSSRITRMTFFFFGSY